MTTITGWRYLMKTDNLCIPLMIAFFTTSKLWIAVFVLHIILFVMAECTYGQDNRIHLYSSSVNNFDSYRVVCSFGSSGSNVNQNQVINGLMFDDERNRILATDDGNRRLAIWSSDGKIIKTIPMPHHASSCPSSLFCCSRSL